MGYYTNFNLSYKLPNEEDTSTQELEEFKKQAEEQGIEVPEGLVVNRQTLQDKLDEALEEDTEYGPYRLFLCGYGDDCKWYEHETEMLSLSRKFPTILFTLKGEGEVAGDLWIKYFKGGKIQVCVATITYDEFDESLLV